MTELDPREVMGPRHRSRSMRSPADDSLAKAYDRLRITLRKFRDQDAADRVRQDVAVVLVTIERVAARYALHPSQVPPDLVFDALQSESDGEYRMEMPVPPRTRGRRTRAR